jgi:flagellar basal-body rod protein FlgC
MSSISAVGVSGLQYASTRLQATASNVANVQTDGYRVRRVTGSEAPSGGVEARVRIDGRAGVTTVDSNGDTTVRSNVDLDREMVDSREAVYIYAANAAVLRRYDDAVGFFLDKLA